MAVGEENAGQVLETFSCADWQGFVDFGDAWDRSS